jgi:hypothetical protein
MTQDETIEMARESGLETQDGFSESVFYFAKLVAEREREECAKVADQISDKYGWGYYGNEVDTADEIAEAIRARGQNDKVY